jgi:hypothetical protein
MEKNPFEAVIFAQLIKLRAFCGTQVFIIVFTRACLWPVSSPRRVQSTSSLTISLKSILILFSHLHLDLPSGIFPYGFPTPTKPL